MKLPANDGIFTTNGNTELFIAQVDGGQSGLVGAAGAAYSGLWDSDHGIIHEKFSMRRRSWLQVHGELKIKVREIYLD